MSSKPVFTLNPFTWCVILCAFSALLALYWMVNWRRKLDDFSVLPDEVCSVLIFTCSAIALGSQFGLYDIMDYLLLIGIGVASTSQTAALKSLKSAADFMAWRRFILPWFAIAYLIGKMIAFAAFTELDGYSIASLIIFIAYIGVARPVLSLKYFEGSLVDSEGEPLHTELSISKYLGYIKSTQIFGNLFQFLFVWLLAMKWLF